MVDVGAMIKFTKDECRNLSGVNQYQVKERNNNIIKAIAKKFDIPEGDAEFVFDNNYDLDKVRAYFEK